MRPFRTAVAVLAAGLALFVAPVAAHATGEPVVNWAHSANDDLGRVEVSVTAGSDVTSLTAHLTSLATHQHAADTSAFSLISGTAADGYWESEPLHLDALGSYSIGIDVADAAGDQVSQPNAGTLAYLVATSIDSVVLDRTTIDYTHRTVTVSGVLNGRWPGAGPTQPLAGFAVLVSGGFDSTQVDTAADGSFSGSVTLDDADFVYAYYPSENDHLWYESSSTDRYPISVDQSATAVTAQLSASTIDDGDPVTVDGTLSWASPDGQVPVPGARVAISYCIVYCGFLGAATTDADGGYSYTLSPGISGTVSVSYSPDDPFVADGVTSADVVVVQPVAFTDFTAARDGDGDVAVAGHILFPGNAAPPQPQVEIQYSTDGADWQTVATLDASRDAHGYPFGAALPEPDAGFWRAYFPAAPTFQSAATEPVEVPAAG